MRKEHLAVIFLIVSCLLSGCGGKVGLGKGGVKFSVPFELSPKEAPADVEQASEISPPAATPAE
ncbi:MAG TPA: hypothetical protein PL125_07080 [Candidatus Omnitrophota bacterium]|nr:hypothetical protein [Candidatus Omnitrophota bacterium]HPT39936.1 hypothetical protein [Candidatus Omnitrophota bacterium]